MKRVYVEDLVLEYAVQHTDNTYTLKELYAAIPTSSPSAINSSVRWMLRTKILSSHKEVRNKNQVLILHTTDKAQKCYNNGGFHDV
jgi:hypothetical protein